MATLAESQHGVVSRQELLALGLRSSTIARRIEQGHLHRLHCGVYAVGHARLSDDARRVAAVLAAGPGAIISHRSAAQVWGLRRSAPPRIEVTAPTRRRWIARRVQVHVARLERDEVTAIDRVPMTTVSRTLLDLAAVASRSELEHALREAEFHGLGDPTSLGTLLQRYRGRRGTATLRAMLAAGRAGDGVTRSWLEERFLPLLDRAALPRPRLNQHVDVGDRLLECDCVWRVPRLVVELDGRSAHVRRAAFESDRARDRALAVAGWTVVRVTKRQLEREPEAVAADVRALLEPVAARSTP